MKYCYEQREKNRRKDERKMFDKRREKKKKEFGMRIKVKNIIYIRETFDD